MAIFEENTLALEEVTVDTLVGEGKKFKTIDDLAKGKAESDRVILAREQELSQLRGELAQRESIEQMLQRNQTPQSAPKTATPELEYQPTHVSSGTSDEDLARRIKEVTKELNQADRVQNNLESVASKLTEVFGSEDGANRAVNAKAIELGVSVEFLQSVAAQSPKAFFAQIGLDSIPTTPQSTPRTGGNVNPEVLGHNHQGPKPGTYGFYQHILKTQGTAAYFDPKIQNQLMKDAFAAAEKGTDFYKT